MAMILDAFMSKYCALLADFVHGEVVTVLGVKDELQKLLRKMKSIQFLLNEAEKRKIDRESPMDNWLSELKDVMYDADDIIDLCRIKGTQLLADRNSKSEPSPVCFNFSSSLFSCFTALPLRHEIGNRIKELNGRLNLIYENRSQLKLENSERSEIPQITQVNMRQTCSMIDPLVEGRELEVHTNELVNLLIAEKVEEKCRLFAVVGMGGIGKTTLAKKIFNHPKIKTFFNLKVWVCVTQTYSETELLKHIIREADEDYGNANIITELQLILRDIVASGQSLFLVLDNVWRADVWVKLLRVPLLNTNACVRVLVTTRYEDVAKVMKAARIQNVMKLSLESSWDMLRSLLFNVEEEQLANDLKELGFDIVKKCGGLPLTIKAIAGVLVTRERTRNEWEEILRSDAWSISNLHQEPIATLHLSFEDLPSYLKQCFLYFSLYGPDKYLNCRQFARLWVAEGFLTESKENSLLEEVAEKYFNELLGRNLLLPSYSYSRRTICKMHDVYRSLALFLSKEETSHGNVNLMNSITFTKLRRLSIEDENTAQATKIVDLVAKQGALRTLLAKNSNLLLNDEILKRLLCLRVLDISYTEIGKLPDSIGNIVHLRYLDLSCTKIRTIPKSIKQLAYLQFLKIKNCKNLTQLPNEITQLYNLRYFDLCGTCISFMPKGIDKLQQLNHLKGFPMANNDSSSKLEDLNFLKQTRILRIENLEGAQCEAIFLKELSHLSKLTLQFSREFFSKLDSEDPIEEERPEDLIEEQRLAAMVSVEELFDKIIPPRSLKKLKIYNFYGRHFPNWMAFSYFENYVPQLTILKLVGLTSCTQLLPLGQLPELRELEISGLHKVKKIGQEILGDGVNSTIRIAFPKLTRFFIGDMDELKEWSFGTQVEENASPRLKLLPCLHKLKIWNCQLLKQLPKGLKHSALKSLSIESAASLTSIVDLPPETEKLKLDNNTNLEKVCCLPMLKKLHIVHSYSLSSMERLDSLQKLKFEDRLMESLPDWLLEFLRQRELLNDINEDFLLELNCSEKAFQGCLKGGSYWNFIQHIPRVIASDPNGSYLRYDKHSHVYIHKAKISD